MKKSLLVFGGIFFWPLLVYGQSALHDPACKKEIKAINQVIDQSRSCEDVSECKHVFFGCPFGCGTPVRKDAEEGLQERVTEYNQKCQPCKYRCQNKSYTVACKEKQCVFH